MNVHWRKLGSVVLAAGATLAIGFAATAVRAQSSSGSDGGWHDRADRTTAMPTPARSTLPATDRRNKPPPPRRRQRRLFPGLSRTRHRPISPFREAPSGSAERPPGE